MRTIRIPPPLLAAMLAHATGSYPRECCGLGTAPEKALDRIVKWHPCRNAQDRFHALDPAGFPRTSKTAYFIEPEELARITRGAGQAGEVVRLIVHSHCDAPVYFSAEDERHALFDGEPLYPQAAHLVISVNQGTFSDMGLFHWIRGQGYVRETIS